MECTERGVFIGKSDFVVDVWETSVAKNSTDAYIVLISISKYFFLFFFFFFNVIAFLWGDQARFQWRFSVRSFLGA